MMTYLVRRALQGLIAVVLVSVLVFVATRLVSDPVTALLPPEATDSQRAALTRQLGLDRPLSEQFVAYVGGVAQLDFGDSMWHRRPAMDIVLERLPNTIVLSIAGMGIALAVGVPLGVLAARRPNSLRDRLVTTLGLTGLSLPSFWLGLMLIMFFSVRLKVLPTGGIGGWRHLLLPAVTLAVPVAGRIAMFTRSTMIDELGQPWIRVAKAKGLRERRIAGVHAMRNATVPILSLSGWELIRVVGGAAVVIETVFAWPGIGFAALHAAETSDLILLQAIVIVVALLTVLINLVTDLMYTIIDPRIALR